MLARPTKPIFFALLALVLIGLGLGYWALMRLNDPISAESRKLLKTRTSYEDRMGVVKPHVDLTRLFGTAQSHMQRFFPHSLAKGSWSSWGSPPTGFVNFAETKQYRVGDPAIISLAADNFFVIYSTRTFDQGEPEIWSAIVEEQVEELGPDAERRVFVVHFAKTGKRTKGSVPQILNGKY